MVTAQETALILIIARINEQIAEREARMLKVLDADELQLLVDEVADLYQSRWEREEALKELTRERSDSLPR
jgi:hypothetical protein